MSLESILKQIKEVKPIADADAEEGPRETLAGRRGRKIQAVETMQRLRFEYTQSIRDNAQYLIVTGSEGKELADALTTGKQGLFSADPEQFYKDLAGRINPALYAGRSTVHDLFDVLTRHLEDKAREIGINGYPQLIFKERYVKPIHTPKDFQDLVQVVINEQMGTEVVGIQAVNSIIDTAIEKGHAANSTSIVLNVASPKLVLDILGDFDRLHGRVYLIIAGECPQTLARAATLENAIRIPQVGKDSVKQVVNTLRGKRNNG